MGAVVDVLVDASITVIRNYIGTVRKDFQRLEEIYDQKHHKSLPSVGNFNCSVICSSMIPNVMFTFLRDKYSENRKLISLIKRYCSTVSFGGNTFLRFRGNSFFEKFSGNSFFSSKVGWSDQKWGRGPPFLGKRGLPQIFWGAPAKFWYRKYWPSFPLVLVW